jgi:hypothetical protein
MSRISLVPFTIVSLLGIIVSRKEAKQKPRSQFFLLCSILEIAVMLLNARCKPEAVWCLTFLSHQSHPLWQNLQTGSWRRRYRGKPLHATVAEEVFKMVYPLRSSDRQFFCPYVFHIILRRTYEQKNWTETPFWKLVLLQCFLSIYVFMLMISLTPLLLHHNHLLAVKATQTLGLV